MFCAILYHLYNLKNVKNTHVGMSLLVKLRKYNIRRNVNPDLSIVTMHRVAIRFFELGVVKKFMQKF